MGLSLSASQFNALKNGVKQAKIQKAQGTADAISFAGELAGTVISTVYAIKNEKTRSKIAEQIDQLTQQQASELADKLQRSSDANEKLSLMAQYLSDTIGKKSASDITKGIEDKYLSESRKTKKQIYWVFGISISVIIIALILKRK